MYTCKNSMKRIFNLIFFLAVICFTVNAQTKVGENLGAVSDSIANKQKLKAHNDSLNAEMSKPDYIIASILVASPGSEIYSVVGHSALRLQCPTKNVDNCYEFASMIDFDTTLEFISGTMEGEFKRLHTVDYINRYKVDGRGIEELVLNLTPKQKTQLWMNVYQQCDENTAWKFDYLVNYCSNMVAWLVESSLQGETIEYHNVDPRITGTYRDAISFVGPIAPWSALFWNIMLGSLGDKPTDFKGHLYPSALENEWQKATIKDSLGNQRPMALSKPVTLLKVTKDIKSTAPTPAMVFVGLIVLALIITFVDYKKGYNILSRIFDVSLFALQIIIGLFVTYLVVFSKQIATDWNWLIIVFNPLPILIWIMMRRKQTMKRAYILFAVVLLLYSLSTPFSPQLLHSHLYLLLITFTIRTIANGFIKGKDLPAKK